jgi:hypothetical protein
MQLPPFIKQIDDKISGWPDNVLTIVLIGLGVFAIVVALKGRPTYKAALAAWFIAP